VVPAGSGRGWGGGGRRGRRRRRRRRLELQRHLASLGPHARRRAKLTMQGDDHRLPLQPPRLRVVGPDRGKAARPRQPDLDRASGRAAEGRPRVHAVKPGKVGDVVVLPVAVEIGRGDIGRMNFGRHLRAGHAHALKTRRAAEFAAEPRAFLRLGQKRRRQVGGGGPGGGKRGQPEPNGAQRPHDAPGAILVHRPPMPITLPETLPAYDVLSREGVMVMSGRPRRAAGHPAAEDRAPQPDAEEDPDRDAVRPAHRRDAAADRLPAHPHDRAPDEEHRRRAHGGVLPPVPGGEGRKFDGLIITGAPIEHLPSRR
jgi:hypothetical protein